MPDIVKVLVETRRIASGLSQGITPLLKPLMVKASADMGSTANSITPQNIKTERKSTASDSSVTSSLTVWGYLIFTQRRQRQRKLR